MFLLLKTKLKQKMILRIYIELKECFMARALSTQELWRTIFVPVSAQCAL